MGQEIGGTAFSAGDGLAFRQRLERETSLLRQLLDAGALSADGPFTGCELESWLVDREMKPAPVNREFLARMADPASSPELAKFNVEFNTSPLRLEGAVLSNLHGQLEQILANARDVGEGLGVTPLLIGILPTVEDAQLNIGNLSELNRYRALNEQIFCSRQGRPLRLNITGLRPLVSVHGDVMLEAATTSFQIHWQIPAQDAVRYFNSAMVASAPIVAASANSPFLFGHDLWAETRIPLFEQAIPVGGYLGAAQGPLHRVSFGTGWARKSIAEVFAENLQHFPVLLPVLSSADPDQFAHLRLHNGTIWRWNRPLVGFDADGRPHIRLEHRAMPAGPTIVDMVANAAFFYGLVESLAAEIDCDELSFAEVRDNFYLAARHGLNASLRWCGGHISASRLILKHLLVMAEQGLQRLGIDLADSTRYLAIIERRVASGQTGSQWQRGFIDKRPGAFAAMTREYLDRQRSGEPVHEWPL